MADTQELQLHESQIVNEGQDIQGQEYDRQRSRI